MLNGTLGTCKTDTVYFELKEESKPICSLPYPLPKVQEEMLKNEVGRLVLLVFLEVANDSEQRSLSFAEPKPKSNQIRFLSDFGNLNKQLKQKPRI